MLITVCRNLFFVRDVHQSVKSLGGSASEAYWRVCVNSFRMGLLGDLPARIGTPGLRAEFRTCARLGVPILLGQCAQMIAPLMDTVMAGRVSAEDLSAVALGNTVWVAVLLFSVGLLGAIQPLVSNALGARHYADIMPLFKAGGLVAVCLSLLGLLFVNLAPLAMPLSDASPQLIQMAADYLWGLSYGILPCFLLFAGRGYCEGLGNTRIFMVIWLTMAALNFPLNVIFIHGYGPIPPMGGVGCGYATAVVNWLGLLIFIAWVQWQRLFDLRSWGVVVASQHVPDTNTNTNTNVFTNKLIALLRLGLPSAFHLMVEGLTFSGLAMLVAVFGPQVIAANQVALNITSFLFMLPLSVGFAFTLRVAYLRGAGQGKLVIALAKSSLWIIVLVSCVGAFVLLYFGDLLVAGYTSDLTVRQLAVLMLIVAAGFQLIDVAQVIWVAVLRGFEDTTVPMWITLFAHWGVGLPVGFLLARTDWFGAPWGPIGLWFGLLAGLVVAVSLLFCRLCWVLRRFDRAAENLPRACGESNPLQWDHGQRI